MGGRRRRVLVGGLVALVWVVSTTLVHAAAIVPRAAPVPPPGRGTLEPQQVLAFVDGAPNLSGGWVPRSRALYRVVAVDLGFAQLVANPCALPPNPPGSWVRWLYRWDGAAWVIVDQRCVPPLASLPPTTGAVAHVVERAPIQPSFEVVPAARGLVGVPVTLTYTGPRQVAVTATLNGWDVNAVATVKAIRWRDGATTLDLRSGPAATAPAQTTFLTSGTKTLTADVTWSGTYVVTDGRGLPVWFDTMADVVDSASAPYPVVAAEAVIG